MESRITERERLDEPVPGAQPRSARRPATSRTRAKVVVIDSGNSADVVVFSEAKMLERGSHFSHRGATWVITGRKRDSGILVAEPASV